MGMFVILQHEPNGTYEFREIDSPEDHEILMGSLGKLAKKLNAKGLKLDETHSVEYKLSHYWHDMNGNEVPVYKPA